MGRVQWANAAIAQAWLLCICGWDADERCRCVIGEELQERDGRE
jgi:hypothetical protein